MHFYDRLWNVTQRAHALMAHWGLLCVSDSEEAGHFHAASLADFLRIVRQTRQDIAEDLAALEQAVVRAQAMLPF
jgi:hypothetical protein